MARLAGAATRPADAHHAYDVGNLAVLRRGGQLPALRSCGRARIERGARGGPRAAPNRPRRTRSARIAAYVTKERDAPKQQPQHACAAFCSISEIAPAHGGACLEASKFSAPSVLGVQRTIRRRRASEVRPWSFSGLGKEIPAPCAHSDACSGARTRRARELLLPL